MLFESPHQKHFPLTVDFLELQKADLLFLEFILEILGQIIFVISQILDIELVSVIYISHHIMILRVLLISIKIKYIIRVQVIRKFADR